MANRKRSDGAELRSRDGAVTATVLLLESDDGRPPLLRLHVTGRKPQVVGLWVGKGADGSDMDVELAPFQG